MRNLILFLILLLPFTVFSQQNTAVLQKDGSIVYFQNDQMVLDVNDLNKLNPSTHQNFHTVTATLMPDGSQKISFASLKVDFTIPAGKDVETVWKEWVKNETTKCGCNLFQTTENTRVNTAVLPKNTP